MWWTSEETCLVSKYLQWSEDFHSYGSGEMSLVLVDLFSIIQGITPSLRFQNIMLNIKQY